LSTFINHLEQKRSANKTTHGTYKNGLNYGTV